MSAKSDPAVESVWMRPVRERRGRPQLSREEIVAKSVELLDAEGLDGLSTRRLGAALSSGATSIYFYVRNKDELLELAVDEVMKEIELGDPAESDWRVGIRELIRSFRAMLLNHPWTLALLGVRPAIGPNAMRMSDRLIGLLTQGGFTGVQVAWASASLLAQAIGTATTDAAMRSMLARTGHSVREIVEEIEPYLESVSADYPSYQEWYAKNKHMDLDPDAMSEERFDFGLDRVLDGLQAWLDAAKPGSTPPPTAGTDRGTGGGH